MSAWRSAWANPNVSTYRSEVLVSSIPMLLNRLPLPPGNESEGAASTIQAIGRGKLARIRAEALMEKMDNMSQMTEDSEQEARRRRVATPNKDEKERRLKLKLQSELEATKRELEKMKLRSFPSFTQET